LKEEDFVTDPPSSHLKSTSFLIIQATTSSLLAEGIPLEAILKTFNTAGVFQKEYVIPSGAGLLLRIDA
jgi:hypothetical protein